MMTLPTLYKTTKTGAIQVCEISYGNSTFTVLWGQKDGKTQTKSTECFVTNEGKANERTPTQQAEFEALAKHKQKIKSGYVTDPSGESQVKLPMKVKVYQDQLKNIKFPCYSSAKLDGVNAIYRRVGTTLTIYSRGGEVYPPIPHLESDIHIAMDMLNSNELNGELYIHGEYLQDIQSAVKKPKPSSSKLSFCIFDICDSASIYKDRRAQLLRLPNRNTLLPSSVSVVCGQPVNSHEEIDTAYNQAIVKGFEGTVIKGPNGLYQHNVRSSHMWKYKKALDAEYEVVGHELDKNSHVVYHCKTPEGLTFKVKRKGTAKERLEDAKLPTANYGKWLTVEYETLSKDKKPLKPVGLNFRDCDSEGNPTE